MSATKVAPPRCFAALNMTKDIDDPTPCPQSTGNDLPVRQQKAKPFAIPNNVLKCHNPKGR
ncbi:MAG: hypothetical protein K2N20_03000, partial [Helicobacter sp.]|nr:hypothetical protein [Helicobacter sp.]